MTSRFADLDFERFKALAKDSSASAHEKVGFPDSYREGKEAVILRDITRKLTNLRRRGQEVVDVGPGCGRLAGALIEQSRRRGHRLFLVDSAEVLSELPDAPHLTKVAGRFPEDCLDYVRERRGASDAVLAYSLLHYVFAERGVFSFLDRSLELLAPGGQLLIGDVPNESRRRRFFASEAGIRYHQRFTRTASAPAVVHGRPEPGKIDDAVLLGLAMRARAAGCHAYLLPQGAGLPMANRREDLLVVRP